MASDTHHQHAVNILLPPSLSPPDVDFSSFAHVLEQCAAERANRVCLVAFGTAWSPPALDSCRHVSAFESANRAAGDCPVRCFCVDAEADGDACVSHGVLPGAATLIGFWRNEPVFFRQTAAAPAAAAADAALVVTSDRRLLGMIGADRIASIADACVAAVERKLQSAAAAGGGTSKERALIVDIEAM